MQERYWEYMKHIKFLIFYLDLYVDFSYACDKWIKIVCAAASSAGIASWALCKQFQFLSAAVIAFSQVIESIKDFLPYSIRLKSMAPFMKSIKLLYNKIEYKWYDIASGKLTDEEINELLYSFEKEFIEMENDLLKQEALLDNKIFMKKASKKNDLYFERFLSGHPQNNRV